MFLRALKRASARGREYSIGEMLRRLWPFARVHKGLLSGSAIAMIVMAAVKALEPWPLKYVFDHVLTPSLAGNAPSDSPWLALSLCAAAYVGVIAVRAAMQYLSQVGFALVGTRVIADVRARLFRHIQQLSVRFHGTARSGDLTVRVVSDVGMLRDVAVTAIMPLIGSVLVLVFMLALMFWLNVTLALVSLSVVPLLFLPTLKISRRIRSVSDVQRRREGKMAAMAAESIGAIRTVQTLTLEESFNQAFSFQNGRSARDGVKSRRLAARLEGTVQSVSGLGTALVLLFGAHLVLRGELTAGSLLVFLSYLKTAFRPVKDLAKYTGRLAKASAAAARVFRVLDEKLDVQEAPDAITVSAVRGDVEFADVHFAYDKSAVALEGVSVRIRAGQRVAVVGASGAGKTTFAMLLSRLADPVSGQVLLDGKDVRRLTLDSVRSNVGAVLQTPTLFCGTIRDNLVFGLGDADDDRMMWALGEANLASFVTGLPEGTDTSVGERGTTLSVGQRQRLAIARLILRDTPVVVFDEPTSALDPINTHRVHEALDRLAAGRTAILITHDLDRAALADRILVFETGKIVQDGSHDELLAEDGAYRALRGMKKLSPPVTAEAVA